MEELDQIHEVRLIDCWKEITIANIEVDFG